MKARLIPGITGVLSLLLVGSAMGADTTWGKKIPVHTKWEKAIEDAKSSGKALFIYYGTKHEGSSRECDLARHALHAFADTQDGYPILRRTFVFLNVYNETLRRGQKVGPEGPYAFTPQSAPLFMIKRCDGLTIQYRKAGTTVTQISRWLPGVVKHATNIQKTYNTKVAALLKDFKKAEKEERKLRVGKAWLLFEKVRERGFDEEHFPEIVPDLAHAAKERAEALWEDIRTDVDAAKSIEEPEARRAALEKCLDRYDGIVDLERELKKALREIPLAA